MKPSSITAQSHASINNNTDSLLLQTSDFASAIRSHLDCRKPDPLAKKQIESLSCQWTPDGSPARNDDVIASGNTLKEGSCDGTLVLSTEYISISVHSHCKWGYCRIRNKDFIEFRLSVSARLISPTIDHQSRRPTHETNIRSGVTRRLKSDSYVRRLCRHCDDESRPDERKEPQQVCEAIIYQNEELTKLEERVWVSEDALEGVRRAILLQVDGNLAVLEFLLDMPYLPGKMNCGITAKRACQSILLADRVVLRLLEDAMVDACEKEGEDELLDDLNISDEVEESADDLGACGKLRTGKRSKMVR